MARRNSLAIKTHSPAKNVAKMPVFTVLLSGFVKDSTESPVVIGPPVADP
jgi:hypothetical protein